MTRKKLLLAAFAVALWSDIGMSSQSGNHDVEWNRISTERGELPRPKVGTTVSTLVFDATKDGRQDIIVAGWGRPSMVLLRQGEKRWGRYIVDAGTSYIEAGGDVYDIDADGDLDIVQGGLTLDPAHDAQRRNAVWWWENPYPRFDPKRPWKRRVVKQADKIGRSHHDQIFGNFLGTGSSQLVFWDQSARTLLMATIPPDVRRAKSWPLRTLMRFERPIHGGKFEGLAKGDVDGDGRLDIAGAGRWFRNLGGGQFEEILLDAKANSTRAAVGDIVRGESLEIIFSPGDAVGPLIWFQRKGGKWSRHVLMETVNNGHSLQVADMNGDGTDDILVAEMGTSGASHRMWIFYGDGTGQFRMTLVPTEVGSHETKVADIDGDGRPDIVQKLFENPWWMIRSYPSLRKFGRPRYPDGRIDIHLNRGAGSTQ